MNMIEMKQVSKSFGATRALKNVSLSLGENRIYGLLGNNGAGKTTLLNLITNRLYADSGEVLIDGHPVADCDRALGKLFMLGEQNLYPDDMRVERAIWATGVFYPDFDPGYAASLCERFGLNRKKKITSLSTGYRSIFRIVLALSANTPYLLLDEPVLGLDAQHRDLFYKLLIEKYSERPCTILLSTHLIQEVSTLVEHTIIIKNGEILKDQPTESLLESGYTVSGPAALVDAYLAGKTVLGVNSLGGLKTASVEGDAPSDGLASGLEISRMDLQDYFIQLMNQEEKAHAYHAHQSGADL